MTLTRPCCPVCKEAYRPEEPCRCERLVFRRAPPLTRGASPACADSQHYACPRYLRTERGTWRGCSCRCHEMPNHQVDEMEMFPPNGHANKVGLAVQHEERGDHSLCRPIGDLDAAGSARLVEALASISATRLVIDLAGVRFIDSAGLGALLGTIRRAREAGGDAALCRPQRQPDRLLQATSFSRVVTLTSTIREAVEALRESVGD